MRTGAEIVKKKSTPDTLATTATYAKDVIDTKKRAADERSRRESATSGSRIGDDQYNPKLGGTVPDHKVANDIKKEGRELKHWLNYYFSLRKHFIPSLFCGSISQYFAEGQLESIVARNYHILVDDAKLFYAAISLRGFKLLTDTRALTEEQWLLITNQFAQEYASIINEVRESTQYVSLSSHLSEQCKMIAECLSDDSASSLTVSGSALLDHFDRWVGPSSPSMQSFRQFLLNSVKDHVERFPLVWALFDLSEQETRALFNSMASNIDEALVQLGCTSDNHHGHIAGLYQFNKSNFRTLTRLQGGFFPQLRHSIWLLNPNEGRSSYRFPRMEADDFDLIITQVANKHIASDTRYQDFYTICALHFTDLLSDAKTLKRWSENKLNHEELADKDPIYKQLLESWVQRLEWEGRTLLSGGEQLAHNVDTDTFLLPDWHRVVSEFRSRPDQSKTIRDLYTFCYEKEIDIKEFQQYSDIFFKEPSSEEEREKWFLDPGKYLETAFRYEQNDPNFALKYFVGAIEGGITNRKALASALQIIDGLPEAQRVEPFNKLVAGMNFVIQELFASGSINVGFSTLQDHYQLIKQLITHGEFGQHAYCLLQEPHMKERINAFDELLLSSRRSIELPRDELLQFIVQYREDRRTYLSDDSHASSSQQVLDLLHDFWCRSGNTEDKIAALNECMLTASAKLRHHPVMQYCLLALGLSRGHDVNQLSHDLFPRHSALSPIKFANLVEKLICSVERSSECVKSDRKLCHAIPFLDDESQALTVQWIKSHLCDLPVEYICQQFFANPTLPTAKEAQQALSILATQPAYRGNHRMILLQLLMLQAMRHRVGMPIDVFDCIKQHAESSAGFYTLPVQVANLIKTLCNQLGENLTRSQLTLPTTFYGLDFSREEIQSCHRLLTDNVRPYVQRLLHEVETKWALDKQQLSYDMNRLIRPSVFAIYSLLEELRSRYYFANLGLTSGGRLYQKVSEIMMSLAHQANTGQSPEAADVFSRKAETGDDLPAEDSGKATLPLTRPVPHSSDPQPITARSVTRGTVARLGAGEGLAGVNAQDLRLRQPAQHRCAEGYGERGDSFGLQSTSPNTLFARWSDSSGRYRHDSVGSAEGIRGSHERARGEGASAAAVTEDVPMAEGVNLDVLRASLLPDAPQGPLQPPVIDAQSFVRQIPDSRRTRTPVAL